MMSIRGIRYRLPSWPMTRYKLVEIFASLQGEGRNTGRQVVFVRFAGCNLSCPWCDTNHAERFTLTLEELTTEIESFKVKSVILTGGEPTIQAGMPELVAELKKRGYWLGVETNGSIDASWLEFVDYVACSPKVEAADKLVLTCANEVRIVASSEKVLEFAKKVEKSVKATDYYISPCDKDGEIDFASAKAALSKLPNWSLSVQLHKILGFR